MRSAITVLSAALLAAAILGPIPATAQVPRTMNYQVMLTDDADQPLADQAVQIVFRIYDDESAGTQKWTETHNVTTNSIGVVSVILGETTPLPPASFGVPLWLEVQANGEILPPRRELVSSPYALHAHDSDNLGGTAAAAYATDAELSTPGTINQPANPVDWTKLKSVPAGFADGTDDAGGAGDGYSLDASDGSPVDAVYVNAAGNVGIGTTSPTRDLHVHRPGTAYEHFTSTATGTTLTDGLAVGTESDGEAYVWNYENQELVLGSNNQTMVTLDPSDAVKIGNSYSWTGALEVYRLGVTTPEIELTSDANGGSAVFSDEGGNTAVLVTADDSGTGGLIRVAKDATYSTGEGIELNGNWGYTEEPALRVLGTDRSAVLSMGVAGNSSVTLPADAIGSTEMLNEPGVARAENLPVFYLTGVHDVITSRTITVPAAGYVLAIGTCNLEAIHTNGTTALAHIGLSATTTLPAAQNPYQQMSSAAPTGNYYFVVTSHELFTVASAGSYTFYYLANEDSGSWGVGTAVLSLAYFPTAYGTVALTARGDFEDAAGSPLTEADVAAEQAEARTFHLARLEGELAEIRTQLEAMKEEGSGQRPTSVDQAPGAAPAIDRPVDLGPSLPAN